MQPLRLSSDASNPPGISINQTSAGEALRVDSDQSRMRMPQFIWRVEITSSYREPRPMTDQLSAPLSRASLIFTVAMSVLMSAWPSNAQDIHPGETPPLTTIGAVRELGAEKAETLALQVKLRGVVTFVNSKGTDFKINDATGGVGVSLPKGTHCPAEGDEVEVIGHTNQLIVQDHLYPHVVGKDVRILGQAAFPKPQPTSVAAIGAFKHYDQWVSVEGVVTMWTIKEPKLSLMITGPDTWAVVHIRGFKESDLPRKLHGARVRVTGVNMGISHTAADAIMAPTSAQLEILEPGASSIFEAKESTVARVLAKDEPLASRLRIRGTVTLRANETTLYIRDGEDALCAELMFGWMKSTTPGIVYADAGPLPVIKPGDVVEMVGSILEPRKESRRNAYALHSCHVRVIDHDLAPQPAITTLRKINAGAHTFDLVQFKARLLHNDQSPPDRRLWRTSMMMESEGLTMPLMAELPDQDAFRSLSPNDEIEVRGVVDKATSYSPRRIRVASAGDVVSLGLAPSVREERLWWWTGSGALVLLVLGAWISTLMRSLHHQRQTDAALRELNATLESRVQERTQQLEDSQQHLERALDQEKQLGDLKTRFVTMVSHEFRTPLGITMSAVELMRHYDDRLPADQRRELCEDIYGATKNMAALMEQMLVLGRVEAGKLGYRPAPLDVATLIVKLTDECLSATSRKCPVITRFEGSLEGAVGDESLLRHIVGNLLTNAVKYSPAGSEVDFTVQRDGCWLELRVADHGIGIPEADQARLFEAFHRGANVGDIPGTGLGLVIVKRCVDLHGGTITMQSSAHQGTTFTVRLPLFGTPESASGTAE